MIISSNNLEMINKIRRFCHRMKFRFLRLIKPIVETTVMIISRKDTERSLLIFDDIFPHLLSGFRIAEYNAYLKEFRNSQALSTATAFGMIRENRTFRFILYVDTCQPRQRGAALILGLALPLGFPLNPFGNQARSACEVVSV